jgi:hypothetical protein
VTVRTAPFVTLLALVLALPAAAQVYTWTDKDGQVHYGDAPPPDATDAKSVAIESKPTDPARIENLEVQKQLSDKQAAMEDELRANQQKRAAEEAANKQAACEAARKRYDNVQYSRKFSTVGADGKETWMSGADADKMKADLKAAADKACEGL